MRFLRHTKTRVSICCIVVLMLTACAEVPSDTASIDVAPSYSAASAEESPFYYFRASKSSPTYAIPLTVDPTRMVVEASGSVDVGTELRDRGMNIEQIRTLRVVGRVHSVVDLRSDTPRKLAEATRSTLRSDSRFTFVSSAYEEATGNRITPVNRLVVRFKDGVSREQIDAFVSREGMQFLRRPSQDWNRPVYWLTYPRDRDPLAVAASVSEHPLVEWASPDKISGFRTSAPNLYPQQYYLNSSIQRFGIDVDIDIANAWTLTKGSPNLRVAVLGTGIDGGHDEFNPNRYLSNDPDCEAGWDDYFGPIPWAPGDAWNPVYMDHHETSVAGIVAAKHRGGGIRGVADKVKLLSARMLHGGNDIPDAEVAEAIRWAWQDCQADVVNGSWGSQSGSTDITDAIEDGTFSGRNLKGTVFVFAAGNLTKRDSAKYVPTDFPAWLPTTISVGAIDKWGNITNYSPTEVYATPPPCGPGCFPIPAPIPTPAPDIVAPSGHFEGGCFDSGPLGANVYTTDVLDPTGACDGELYPGYNRYFSGTSAAAPQVAGAAILLLSREGGLGWADVKNRLLDSADYWGSQPEFGHGKLNVARSLGFYTIPAGPPPIGSLTLDGPSMVQPNQQCTWWASATGGVTPYTFKWYKNGVYKGTGTEIMLATGSSPFTLRLDLRDGASQTESTSLSVSISGAADPCFM
jgi:Subtilase family